MIIKNIKKFAIHLSHNHTRVLAVMLALGLNATTLHADDNAISDTTVRVIGFNAGALVDLIKKHNLAPEGVQVFGPDEPGDVATQFIMLIGWQSLGEISGAKQACGKVCDKLDEEVQLVSRTLIDGEKIKKWVFIELQQLAPNGNIVGSLGLSGCIADQLFNEARMIKPKAARCIPRLALGSFTDRRNVGRR